MGGGSFYSVAEAGLKLVCSRVSPASVYQVSGVRRLHYCRSQPHPWVFFFLVLSSEKIKFEPDVEALAYNPSTFGS